MSNKKCNNCGLTNFSTAEKCVRCDGDLLQISISTREIEPDVNVVFGKFLVRASITIGITLALLVGFYVSLILTSASLKTEQKQAVERAIDILEKKGFRQEVFVLRNLTSFRASDHWLNASLDKPDAYASTNFPFEIVTLYEKFFTEPIDDTERAQVLLHEAQHLFGKNEHDAYKKVWRDKVKLSWTEEIYGKTRVWYSVKKGTHEHVPEFFICEQNPDQDCTK